MVWRLGLSRISHLLTCVIVSFCILSAAGQVKVGAPAPVFTGNDSNGKTETLEQFRGR
jgi:hypothetical protein